MAILIGQLLTETMGFAPIIANALNAPIGSKYVSWPTNACRDTISIAQIELIATTGPSINPNTAPGYNLYCPDRIDYDPTVISTRPQIELLARLPEMDRLLLLQIGQTHRFHKSGFIFRAGDATHHVYLLLRGRVKIYQPSSIGKEVILWFCFGGELFGLAEAARGGERVVSAQACDESEILCIRQEQFTEFLLQHPRTALMIVQVLSCRLRVLGDAVINLVSDDVRTRVLKMLLQLGLRCGTPHEQGLLLNLSLTHQEIADMIGTTRQTVTTVLGQLEREAKIKIEHHMIYIVDETMLSRLHTGAALLPA